MKEINKQFTAGIFSESRGYTTIKPITIIYR